MIVDNVRLYRPDKTDDPEQVHHIIIENGKISEIKQGRSPHQGDNVYDADQRTIMTSMTDSHLHLLRYGLMKTELDLREVESWEELKKEVREYYPYMEEHDWIVGRGLEDDDFPDLERPLTAQDLDEIHLNKPMFFMHRDGHECVVNETVLNQLKEEETFLEKVPEDFIEKDENGDWNGRFKDTAVHYIKRHFRSRPKDEAKEAIEAAVPYLLKNGITSVHTDDLNFIKNYTTLMESYQELEKEGKLPVDVFLHYYIFQKKDLEHYLEEFNLRSGDGSEKVKVGSIKIFLDGTQRLHTAAMRMPYHDKPETAGDCIYTQEELNEIVRLASENNMQVAMHALGDRATEQAIAALEQKEVDVDKLRHRIIHAQTLGPDLLDRMRDLKPYIEVQPSFLMDEYDEKAIWVGEDLAPYCDAFGSLQRNKIPYTLSSDAPIGDLNPFVSIFGAVNRTDLNHKPEGGWVPSEKLTVNQAFEAFTYTPRLLEFQENLKGRLEEGYEADFLILDLHPLQTDKKELHKIGVEEVWVKGQRVYSPQGILT